MSLRRINWKLAAYLLLLTVSARYSEGQPEGFSEGSQEDDFDSDEEADESSDSLMERIKSESQVLDSSRTEHFLQALEGGDASRTLHIVHEQQTELTSRVLQAQLQQANDDDSLDRLGKLLDFKFMLKKLYRSSSSGEEFDSHSASINQSAGATARPFNSSSLDNFGDAGQASTATAQPAFGGYSDSLQRSFEDPTHQLVCDSPFSSSRSEAPDKNLVDEFSNLKVSPPLAKQTSQSASQKRKTKANREKESPGTPSCLNSFGRPVDWFVTIKKNLGWKYLSVTAAGWEQDMKLYRPNNDIRKSGPVLNTLMQATANVRRPSHIILAYNDQYPNTSSRGYAHAKGVVMFDTCEKRGFWIVHSIPKFPDLSTLFLVFPDSAKIYAQSFGCSTIKDRQQFNSVLQQLRAMNVSIYYSRPTSDIVPHQPAENQIPHLPLVYLGLLGQVFHLTKANKYNSCIYCDLSNYLQTNMLTETWRTQQNQTYHHIQSDIKVFGVDFANGFKYSANQDHSKWSVSDTSSKPWLCIGDLNRYRTTRGGGVLCFGSKLAQRAFCQAARDENSLPFKCY